LGQIELGFALLNGRAQHWRNMTRPAAQRSPLRCWAGLPWYPQSRHSSRAIDLGSSGRAEGSGGVRSRGRRPVGEQFVVPRGLVALHAEQDTLPNSTSLRSTPSIGRSVGIDWQW